MPVPLAPAEKIILKAKIHWVILLWPALFTGFGLFCSLCSILTALAEPEPPQQPPPEWFLQCLAFFGVSIFLIALIWAIAAMKEFISSEFILTNRRLILEWGGFRRNSLDMYLKRIDSLYVDRSILGQILGYGNINIRGGSQALAQSYG